MALDNFRRVSLRDTSLRFFWHWKRGSRWVIVICFRSRVWCILFACSAFQNIHWECSYILNFAKIFPTQWWGREGPLGLLVWSPRVCVSVEISLVLWRQYLPPVAVSKLNTCGFGTGGCHRCWLLPMLFSTHCVHTDRCHMFLLAFQVSQNRTWIYDPLLSQSEKELADKLGLSVILENEVSTFWLALFRTSQGNLRRAEWLTPSLLSGGKEAHPWKHSGLHATLWEGALQQFTLEELVGAAIAELGCDWQQFRQYETQVKVLMFSAGFSSTLQWPVWTWKTMQSVNSCASLLLPVVLVWEPRHIWGLLAPFLSVCPRRSSTTPIPSSAMYPRFFWNDFQDQDLLSLSSVGFWIQNFEFGTAAFLRKMWRSVVHF